MDIRPTINVSLFGKKRKADDTTVPTEEPTPDYIKLAEEAAGRLGKKLLVGAVIVIVTTAIAAAASNIAVNAFDNAISE